MNTVSLQKLQKEVQWFLSPSVDFDQQWRRDGLPRCDFAVFWECSMILYVWMQYVGSWRWQKSRLLLQKVCWSVALKVKQIVHFKPGADTCIISWKFLISTVHPTCFAVSSIQSMTSDWTADEGAISFKISSLVIVRCEILSKPGHVLSKWRILRIWVCPKQLFKYVKISLS